MRRRDFLTGVPAAVAGSLLFPSVLRAHQSAAPAFILPHPFITAHPEAVFIRRTAVADKLDEAAKRAEGLAFARECFTPSETQGVPFTNAITVKPNLTCTSGTGNTPAGMGIITDLDFLDGLIGGMRETGFPGYNMFAREGNWMANGYCAGEYLVTGVKMNAIARKHGMHLFDFESGRMIYDMQLADLVSGTEVIWRDVPSGEVFRRIGYLAPFNDDDAWMLNVAKFKTHSMGMTLCAKNLQGTVVSPYVRFCEGIDNTRKHPAEVLRDFHTDFEQRVDDAYARHLAAGIPRWDRPGRDASGGYGMETWAQRTCDSHTVMRPGLHVIEGIYGRNGDGFNHGPGTGDAPQDFMSNILVFGTNPFLVDVIGTWLAGHEPGNFGLFHIALERGLLPMLDPAEVPLYDWNGGTPQRVRLSDQPRTPLLCPYLRRDYNGQSEARYHMVDEPFVYGTVSAGSASALPQVPELHALTNPVRTSTLLAFTLPRPGTADIYVHDASGRKVWSWSAGWRDAGAHTVQWTPGRLPAGMYIARLHTRQGTARTRIIVLR